MCRILAIPGIKKEHTEKAWKLVEKMRPLMSRANNDGFGYAAITAKGELFGERWLKNHEAFSGETLSTGDKALLNNLGDDLLEVSVNSNSFGTVDKNAAVSIIAHARKATCEVVLENVHPFIEGNVALIHNGVISNHEQLTKKHSSCDSESILHEYIEYNVANLPEQIDGVVQELMGWYASAVLTMGNGMPNGEKIPIMDLFKDTQASLHCVYVNELETFIFSTYKTDLEEVLKDMEFKVNNVFKIKDNFFVRLDAVTGERLHSQAIKKISKLVGRRRQDDTPVLPAHNDYTGNEDWLALLEAEEKERLIASKDARSVN